MPDSLSFDNSSGSINGNAPTTAITTDTLTITATGTGDFTGSKTATLILEFTSENIITGSFSYSTTSLEAKKNNQINEFAPTWTNATNEQLDNLTYTIENTDSSSVAFTSTGLSINKNTGIISGNPNTVIAATFIVTATGKEDFIGALTTTIQITIIEMTEAEKETKDTVTTTEYQSEADGAPSKTSWVDAFRHYPELDFFKKGRYPLIWRKDPGEKGINAERWELYMIKFNDPANITVTHTLRLEDVKETIKLTGAPIPLYIQKLKQ